MIVEEGASSVAYTLDESLIEFGGALEDRDFDRAVAILEPLPLTPETEVSGTRREELGKIGGKEIFHKREALKTSREESGKNSGGRIVQKRGSSRREDRRRRLQMQLAKGLRRMLVAIYLGEDKTQSLLEVAVRREL